MPVSKILLFYLGGGPDLYYTEGGYKYKIADFFYDADDDFLTFGLHGLVGIEWYFYKYPAKSEWYNSPVSLVVEYKYSWVEIIDADNEVTDNLNNVFKLNLSRNDFDVGGHIAFIGIRWHF